MSIRSRRTTTWPTFDLSLSVVDQGNRLTAELSSNRELFDRDTSMRMLERFRTLLDAALADPDARIWTMPLLGADEYRQVLGDWNQTARRFESDDCLHQLFEAQVERTPDAIAVSSEEERADLRRTEQTGEPAGPLPPQAGRRSGRAGGSVGGALAGPDRRAARRFQKPAAHICRSTRRTRGNGWRSCFTMPRSGVLLKQARH